MMIKGYCMKCNAKRTMENPKNYTMSNGVKAVRGKCSKCGTKMSRLGKWMKDLERSITPDKGRYAV